MGFELMLEPYTEQRGHWPGTGQHIMAQYDDEHIVVYQAYNPTIGHFAAENDYFDAGFKLGRMTWIKPNFLWMMHRSGWGTKENQEVVLAIWMPCVAFDAILKKAVHSSFQPELYDDYDQWQRTVSASNIRLQWDPDYDPGDNRLERRAIQIGLVGKSAVHYAQGGWISHIEDITDLVRQQHRNAKAPYTDLLLPRERVYTVHDPDVAARIGVSSVG